MSTPKPLKRPDRPPKADAEAWNADVKKKIDNKIERILELMADVKALGDDIVSDAEDTAKDAVKDIAALVSSFVTHFDFVKDIQRAREDKKQRAAAVLQAAGIPIPQNLQQPPKAP